LGKVNLGGGGGAFGTAAHGALEEVLVD
jgi:hypothetical protein